MTNLKKHLSGVSTLHALRPAVLATALLSCVLSPVRGVAAPLAVPSVTAPERVYAEAGDWVFFSVTTDGKGVEFVPLDPGLTLFPPGKLKDPTETGVRALKAGTYRLLVYSGNADGPSKPKVVLVVVGNPPNPPTPGPIVPDPVIPDPVTPKPVNPLSDPDLVRDLKAALAKDVERYGVGDKKHASALGTVFLETASMLRKDKTDSLTVEQLYSITFNASVAAGVPRRDSALTETRKVIDALGKVDPKTILTGADKDRIAALWEKVGASLQEAAK